MELSKIPSDANKDLAVASCRRCGGRAKRIRTMLDSAKGLTVRTFRCECGEEIWFTDRDQGCA